MMNMLLKRLQKVPLTLAAVQEFLLQAAKLAIIGELRADDWVYLAHLIVYRTTTRCGANDKQKAMLAETLHQIEEQKNTLGSMFN